MYGTKFCFLFFQPQQFRSQKKVKRELEKACNKIPTIEKKKQIKEFLSLKLPE